MFSLAASPNLARLSPSRGIFDVVADEHTIDKILNAAREELKVIGIGGFRTRRVAEAARISLGTLTHYFPTKERLLETVAHVFLKTSWGNWNSQADAIGGEGLGPIVAGFYDICRRHRSIVRLIIHLSARDGSVWGVRAPAILRPLLDDAERRLGPDKRLLACSIVCLAMDYAVFEEEELLMLVPARDKDDVHGAVLRHLTMLANVD